MNWDWNTFWTYFAITAGFMLACSVITSSIAAAVIKVRKSSHFGVELDVPELEGYGGKIFASFETEDQLIHFVQRHQTDLIRWTESPDRSKR